MVAHLKGTPRLGGYLAILFSALLFGTYGIWSRLMGETFEPFYQAWSRSILIIILMLPFMAACKSFRRIERKDWPHAGVFILFCVFTQVPIYYAFNHAPIGTVQLIFYALFVITAYLVGKIYLGEHINRIKLLSMLLAFAGLAIVFGASVAIFAPIGLALAALNGIASGGEVSSSKRLSGKYPPALLIFWGWIFTLITHLPLSLLTGETQHMPQLNEDWLWLVVYAIVNIGAFWFVVAGFRFVDASIGSLVGLTEVLFGMLFGAILFSEALTWSVGIGGACIILAAMLPDLLSIIAKRRKRQLEKLATEP